MRFQKVTWSPVEIEYLKKNKDTTINQLTVALGKSRNAINIKLKEIKTGKVANPKKGVVRSKIGKRPDCNNLFFRSGWEANVFRIFRLDPEISHIEYEPTDFTFWQFGIKKGTMSYTPDFKITYPDGTYNWVEVKGGWMKPTDKVKIRRMKKFYPEEFNRLIAITPGSKSKTAQFFKIERIPIKYYYPELVKLYRKTIPNWE